MLWWVFQGAILVYTGLGIRHQVQNPVAWVDERTPVIWTLALVFAGFVLAVLASGKWIRDGLARNMTQWGLLNCSAVLGLVLAFLGAPWGVWLCFPGASTGLMVYTRPR